MRLTDLSPAFIKLGAGGGIWHHDVPRSEAQGVMFDCPVCKRHRVICWAPEVPLSVPPGPGRWTLVGDSFETLTLAVAPPETQSSVQMDCAHFHVQNGDIVPA